MKRFQYRATGHEPAELYCEPKNGATLMIFSTWAICWRQTRNDPSGIRGSLRLRQFQGSRVVLEAGLEESWSTFVSVTMHPLSALPKPGSGGIDLASAVNSAVATEIGRTTFSGLLILADSADTERLFCAVDGARNIKIRWVR